MESMAIAAAILSVKRLDDERADRRAFARADILPALAVIRRVASPRTRR